MRVRVKARHRWKKRETDLPDEMRECISCGVRASVRQLKVGIGGCDRNLANKMKLKPHAPYYFLIKGRLA